MHGQPLAGYGTDEEEAMFMVPMSVTAWDQK